MALNMKIFLCGIAVFFGLFFSIPFRLKKITSRTGTVLYKTSQPSAFRGVVIYFMGFILLVVTIMRNFGPLPQAVLCACALLGENLAMREFMLIGKYGAYENGIISTGMFIEYSDIVTFPVLNLPADEQEHYAKNELVVATESKGNITLNFATEEECARVTEIAKEKTGR